MGYVKYSSDIKIIAVRLKMKGEDLESINQRLDIQISRQSLTRWTRLYITTNSVLANPQFYEGRGAPTILSAGQRVFITEMLEDDPTLYLDEIAERLQARTGALISISALAIEIRDRLVLTRKVARTVHPNQSPIRRGEYLYEVGGIKPECLVFLDESAIAKRRLYRRYARSIRGQRTERLQRPTNSTRFTVLPAISLEGCIALQVKEGSFKRVDFESYLENHLLPMMNPWPEVNSCLVLDNAPIHHGGEIEDLCERFGVRLLYLAPYSPDFNPIEKAFSVIKSRLRRTRALIGDFTSDEEAEIIYTTAEDVLTPHLIRSLYEGSVYL